MRRLTAFLLMAAVGCHAPAGRTAATPDTTDARTGAAADGEMANMAGMRADPHMSMTPAWPLAAGDSARANALVDLIRANLGKYQDVRVAVADGFKEFL